MVNSFCYVDFETRSPVNLPAAGAYLYAQHPDTDILCLSWAIGDAPVALWRPGEPIPVELADYLAGDGLVAAHNAQFERLIWRHILSPRYAWPMLPLERFYCTAALCRSRGFPGGLDKAARFAGLSHQKDMSGYRLMMKLSRPRGFDEVGKPIWWNDPDEHQRLGEYCQQDTEVERALAGILMPFNERELADYHLSERINDRGVRVDIELARAAVEGAAHEKFSSANALRSLTAGEVTTHSQVARILAWVKKQGVELPDLSKGTVNEALESNLPDDVREVLEIRLAQSKAAVSKFQAMMDRQSDGVVRGLFMFRGAGQTGRYSSVGLQIHNLIRESAPEAIPVLKRHGIKGLKLLGDPVHLLSRMVRPAFIPSPGKVFLISDYAQVEARITAWLAGEEKLLDAFRAKRDVYCEFATTAYHRMITKADKLERFVGKGCILGLGFGGGIGALARTLKAGGVTLPENERQRLVDTYRKTYTSIPSYWRVLERSILMAMGNKGSVITAGKVSYLFDGVHLWCRLPSTRLMCYPFSEVVEGEYGEVVQYRRGNRSPKAGEKGWPVVQLWGGILMENLAQAIALDLLMNALRQCEETVRIHVHDEIVAEGVSKGDLTQLITAMENVPEWAVGLPIEAEGKLSGRYTK
jgi:DNA polymerase